MKTNLTIYNVQVNCARLSKEKVENLARIVKENGGKIWHYEQALSVSNLYCYFSSAPDDDFFISGKSDSKVSISYARFVDLFDKKGLEVGKWYKFSIDNCIKFCFNGTFGQETQFGFNCHGDWSNKLGIYNFNICTPLTEQEVSELLITEAKRRGFTPYYDFFYFNPTLNTLYDRFGLGQEVIFNNGIWAEVLVQRYPESLIKPIDVNMSTTAIEKPKLVDGLKEYFNTHTPEEIDKVWNECQSEITNEQEEEASVDNMDRLTKPSHYKNESGYDVINLWQDNNLNANQGAICKYIVRAGKKLYPNMNELESYLADLEKAQVHISREIEFVKSKLASNEQA